DENIVLARIEENLAERLPAYMLPAFIELLQALPLTPNGKVDRKALPEPAIKRKAFVAPENETERKLKHLWQSLLAQDNISTLDNFFELGGQSLLATRLMSQIRESLGVDLPLRVLFEQPTIQGLAKTIDNNQMQS